MATAKIGSKIKDFSLPSSGGGTWSLQDAKSRKLVIYFYPKDMTSGCTRESQDFRATSLETLRQMVATGAGVTLLPELAARGAYRNARGVVLRPFARPVPVRHIGAVWRKSTARGAAIDALGTLISEHAS